jgi:hypothetical protein
VNSDLPIREMMKRIDVYGRLAYGGQIVAAMAMIAGLALFVACAVLVFTRWNDNRAEALTIWLGGWALAVVIAIGGIAFALFCWRWSGDWITEWPGYALGIGIAAAADGVLAWMLTSSPVPIPLSFVIVAGAAFLAAFLVAGNLAGTQVLESTRSGQRALVRRR